MLDQSSHWITATTSYTTASPAWGIQINGYNIAQVTGTTSATTSGPTSSATGTGTPPSQPSSGLSTGAKAGIGIGVALVAIALGALLVFILARRKKRSQEYAVAGLPPTAPVYEPKKEHTQYGGAAQHGGGYKDQVPVHELGDQPDAGLSELDGSGVPAELQTKR